MKIPTDDNHFHAELLCFFTLKPKEINQDWLDRMAQMSVEYQKYKEEKKARLARGAVTWSLYAIGVAVSGFGYAVYKGQWFPVCLFLCLLFLACALFLHFKRIQDDN